LLAADALLRAYGQPAAPMEMRVDGQTFNVTNDERILFWDFQRHISAAVGFPVKKEEIKVIPKWVAMLMAATSEYSTWIWSWGTRQSAVTREAVRLTAIERTMNGEKAKRVLGYSPKVSILEGIERGGKWFVEEEKIAAQAKKTV
jgi:sterol-4alpha-carboxylate 3-dehydrogenase (decarboxylating)